MKLDDNLRINTFLSKLKHKMRNEIEATLKAYQLTYAKYSALSVIEIHGSLTNAEIARKCWVKPQTMIRIATDLQNQKLISSDLSKVSKKMKKFKLTKKAEKALCKAHVEINSLESLMLKGFSKKEEKIFVEFLNRSYQNLEDLT